MGCWLGIFEVCKNHRFLLFRVSHLECCFPRSMVPNWSVPENHHLESLFRSRWLGPIPKVPAGS